MTKFDSITTPDVKHDSANAVTELILLNKDLLAPAMPWREKQYRGWWGKTVACVKKLMKQHELSADQLAFYVVRCRTTAIDSNEFAKAAIVAKKLLQKQDIGQAMNTYRNRRSEASATPIAESKGRYKAKDTKTLSEFLRELEDNG